MDNFRYIYYRFRPVFVGLILIISLLILAVIAAWLSWNRTVISAFISSSWSQCSTIFAAGLLAGFILALIEGVLPKDKRKKKQKNDDVTIYSSSNSDRILTPMEDAKARHLQKLARLEEDYKRRRADVESEFMRDITEAQEEEIKGEDYDA